ncbi:hypothetical protein ES705_41557 [subsurface metagenome]
MRIHTTFILSALIIFSAPAVPDIYADDQYIIVTGESVNIRTGVGITFPFVCDAREGDIFELIGKEGDWYKINMFSGEWRYIHAIYVKPTNKLPAYPDDDSVRQEIFLALLEAENKALEEADKKYPYWPISGRKAPEGNIEKNIDYQRILDDKYSLDVFHKFIVQPPIYTKIIVESLQKDWYKLYY